MPTIMIHTNNFNIYFPHKKSDPLKYAVGYFVGQRGVDEA